MSLRQRLENLSCLFPSSLLSFLLCSFCPEFLSSSCISVSHHAFSNIAPPYLPRPVFLFAIHLSFVFVHFTPPLSFNCLSLCHFAAPFFIANSSLSLIVHTSAHSPSFLLLLPLLLLSVRHRLRSQLTFATRRCSCARTEEHATRTRSASVLQSLRGYCANSPAARRARTATPPLPCTSPRPPCCSALC